MKLTVKDLELMPYEEAYRLQEQLLSDVQSGAEDHLLLLEHPKVITMGINAKDENVLMSEAHLEANGYALIKTRRGGDVTYHGPGQLVGYTLFDIKKRHGGSIKNYVRKLETLLIQLLKTHYQIDAHTDPINAGVFVGNDKIIAIGLSVHNGVTMHGFAFNINTALDDYLAIVPCGLQTRGVTSLEKLLGAPQSMAQVKEHVEIAFKDAFGFE